MFYPKPNKVLTAVIIKHCDKRLIMKSRLINGWVNQLLDWGADIEDTSGKLSTN